MWFWLCLSNGNFQAPIKPCRMADMGRKAVIWYEQ